MAMMPATPDDVHEALSLYGYIPDEGLSTSVFLSMVLQRPLLPRPSLRPSQVVDLVAPRLSLCGRCRGVLARHRAAGAG